MKNVAGVKGGSLCHIAAGHNVCTGAADVGQHHVTHMDGRVQHHAVQRGNHLGHLSLGHGLGGLDRAAGVQAALGAHGAGNDAGGVGQFFPAVGGWFLLMKNRAQWKMSTASSK